MSNSSIKELCLSSLQKLKTIPAVMQLPESESSVQYFEKRFLDEEFRIAIVGEYSSGKSTFLNALLQKDILTHATTETTAAVTRLVNVPVNDPRAYTGEVVLASGKRIRLQNFEDIREYTTQRSVKYDVVHDIASVELFLPFAPSDRKIVLIDTPGLNGTAEGHRERTIDLVKQAHACIYLLQLRGLSESDISFIRLISRYQKNFIFVQNFIDELNGAEGETLERKLEEQKKILSEQVFSSSEAVHYSLCGVSALLALTYFDHGIKVLYEGDLPLTEEQRNNLYLLSHFGEFLALLDETFQKDQLEVVQYRDTALVFQQWIQEVIQDLSIQENNVRGAYEISHERRSIDKLTRLKEKTIRNSEVQKEYLQNFIVASCSDIRKAATVMLKTNLEQVCEELSLAINQYQTVDELEQWSQYLGAELHDRIQVFVTDCETRCELELQTLYRRLLCRIEEYSGIKTESLTFDKIKIHLLSAPSFDAKRSGTIEKLQAKLQQTQDQQMQYSLLQKQKEDAQQDIENELVSIIQQKKQADSLKDAAIKRLGKKPSPKKKIIHETEQIYRGGLGLLDFLFPIYDDVPKEIVDNSNVQRWKAKYAKITNDYATEIAKLDKQLRATQRALAREKKAAEDAVEKCSVLEDRIQKLKEKIRLEETILQAQKEKAAFEFLQKYRKDLKRQIESYLLTDDASVLAKTEELLSQSVSAAQIDYIKKAVTLYEGAVQKKLQWIDQTVQRECPELLRQADQLADLIAQLNAIQTSVEECVNGKSI